MLQLFDLQSSTYTYLLFDQKSGAAVLIDPVLENVARDLKLIQDMKLKLELVLETHIHADHVTGAGELKEKTGCRIGVAKVAGTDADLQLEDGQVVQVGGLSLKVMATPGHTDSCLSFYTEGKVFTGDALMIRGCGRTDFQQGSADRLFLSVHEKLFRLPPTTQVFPAHDYNGIPSSSIALEQELNPRLGGGTTREQFVQIMNQLKLAPPKKIQQAVPANMNLGRRTGGQVLKPKLNQNIPEIEPSEVHTELGGDFMMIDVRRPDEYNAELGHVEGARLVTLGPELMQFLEQTEKDKEIVFICRSGGRSGQATALSRDFGFQHTMNMVGGMLRWNELQLPVIRNAPQDSGV